MQVGERTVSVSRIFILRGNMVKSAKYHFEFELVDRNIIKPGLNLDLCCLVDGRMEIVCDRENPVPFTIVTPFMEMVKFRHDTKNILPSNSKENDLKISTGELRQGHDYFPVRFDPVLHAGENIIDYRYRLALKAFPLRSFVKKEWMLSALFDMAHIRKIGMQKDVLVEVTASAPEPGLQIPLLRKKNAISFSGKNYSEEQGVSLSGRCGRDDGRTIGFISFGRDIPDQLSISIRI